MAKIVHHIKAFLHPFQLTGNPKQLTARVASERSLGIQEICKSAANRGDADLSAATMQHGVELFLKEMAYCLCDGYSVNTGYFTASPSIRGVFSNPDESFNPQKHSLLFQFSQGEMLRKQLPGVEVQILGLADCSIHIARVTDLKSGSVNHLITPNRNLKIEGTKIKLEGDDPQVGVWFIHAETGTRTPVDPTDIISNLPTGVMIVVPALETGTYRLEITTQFTGGSNRLKQPRSAVFAKELVVP